jgi:hypothetical protein
MMPPTGIHNVVSFLATITRVTLFLLGYISLMSIIPRKFPPEASLPNVAAQIGYDPQLAYFVIIAWSIVGLSYFAFINRHRANPVGGEPG